MHVLSRCSPICRCIKPSRQTIYSSRHSSQNLSGSQSSLHSTDSDGRRKANQKASDSRGKDAKRSGSGDMDKSTMFAYVQLFEPLVIRAMNLYTVTSSIPLQQQILYLLCRLLTLRVKYDMLDGNHLFIKSVLKQLELIENGHVRDSHLLLSHLFQFLTLLTQDSNKLDELVSMPRVIQLVDGLLASVHLAPRLSLPAVQPIVQDLFLQPNSKQAHRGVKQDELDAWREVVMNTLIKQIQHPPVWEQLTLLLDMFQIDEDKWKRFSRKIIDGLLPLLSSGKVAVRSAQVLGTLNTLLRSVAPIALRPVVMLFNCLFDVAAPHIMIDGMDSPEKVQAGEEKDVSRSQDLRTSTLVVMLLSIIQNNEVAILSGVAQFLPPGSAGSDDAQEATPEDAFMKFLFDIIELIAERFQGRKIITEFYCQEFAQMLRIIYTLVQNRESHPRLFGACHTAAMARAPRLNTLIRRTIFIKPLLAVYWTQLLVVVGCSHSSWLETLSLESVATNAQTRSQEIALRGAFLLSCEQIAAAVRALGPSSATETKMLALLQSKSVHWYKLTLHCSRESPVKDFFEVVMFAGGGLADILVRKMSEALAAVSTQQMSVSFQHQVLQLLDLAPPSVGIIMLLIKQALAAKRFATRSLCDAIAGKKLSTLWETGSEPGEQLLSDVAPLFAAFEATHNPSSLPVLRKTFQSIGMQVAVRRTTIEQLMSVAPQQWHRAYVTETCSSDTRMGRSNTAVHQLLDHLANDTAVQILSDPTFDSYLYASCLKPQVSFRTMATIENLDESWDPEETERALESNTVAELLEPFLFDCVSKYSVFTELVPGTRGTSRAAATEAQVPEDQETLALDKRTHICAALTVHYESSVKTRSNPTITSSADTIARIRNALTFSCTSLKLVCNPDYKLNVSEYSSVLRCTANILCLPEVSVLCEAEGTIFDKAWYNALVTNVATAYKSFAAPGSLVIATCDAEEDDDQGMASMPDHDEERFCELHLQYTLIGRLNTHLRACCMPPIKGGITHQRHIAYAPPFILSQFKRIFIAVIRLDLSAVNTFGIIVNPDSGALPRDARALFVELADPAAGVELKEELVSDELVLESVVRRLKLLGYTSNKEFEAFWDDMVRVLSPSEAFAALQGSAGVAVPAQRLAIKAMSSSLMYVLKSPQAGDPQGASRFYHRVRDIPFLHTKIGSKLVRLREALVQAGTNVSENVRNPTTPYCVNIERDFAHKDFGFGQVSVAMLHSYKIPQELEAHASSSAMANRRHSTFAAAMLHNSLDFMTTTFSNIFTNLNSVTVAVLVETVKSVLLLSDLFTSEAQHEWVLHNFIEIYKVVGADDPVLARYLVAGVTKMVAILTHAGAKTKRRQPQMDMVSKMIQDSLQQHKSLSVQTAALHGCVYLIDSKTHSVIKPLLAPITEYLAQIVKRATSSQVQPRVFAVAFCLAILMIEQYPSETDELGLVSMIVEVGVKIIVQPSTTDEIFSILVNGLDRLLLSFTLGQGLRERIESVAQHMTKTTPALASSTFTGSQRVVLALGLMITCMYTGRDGDRAGALTVKRGGMASDEIDNMSAASTSQISAIFHRANVAGASEARLIANVLPILLSDLLDLRQIMNVIMEKFTRSFVDNTQCDLIATVVHNYFEILHIHGQQEVAREWVVLSSSNFLQLPDRKKAVTSLACLLASVSQEPAIRSLYASVINYTQVPFVFL